MTDCQQWWPGLQLHFLFLFWQQDIAGCGNIKTIGKESSDNKSLGVSPLPPHTRLRVARKVMVPQGHAASAEVFN